VRIRWKSNLTVVNCVTDWWKDGCDSSLVQQYKCVIELCARHFSCSLRARQSFAVRLTDPHKLWQRHFRETCSRWNNFLNYVLLLYIFIVWRTNKRFSLVICIVLSSQINILKVFTCFQHVQLYHAKNWNILLIFMCLAFDHPEHRLFSCKSCLLYLKDWK